jgi:hypothetical protein
MTEAPIPKRIPELAWRAPAGLWIPLALALAIGWPAALFQADPAAVWLALTFGAAVFAAALASLALRWLIRGPPKARRVIVRHVVVAAAIAALFAPLALGADASVANELAMLPLALLLGLPVALASGVVFAFVALTRAPLLEERSQAQARPPPREGRGQGAG